MNRLYKTLIGAGLIAGSLTGCDSYKLKVHREANSETEKSYFLELEMDNRSGMAMTSGDFDGDGDLDVIVGVRPDLDFAKLYFLENDGKGNFTVTGNH